MWFKFEIPVTEGQVASIQLDKTADECRWFFKVEDYFHQTLKDILRQNFCFP